jgi:hypothetical protein
MGCSISRINYVKGATVRRNDLYLLDGKGVPFRRLRRQICTPRARHFSWAGTPPCRRKCVRIDEFNVEIAGRIGKCHSQTVPTTPLDSLGGESGVGGNSRNNSLQTQIYRLYKTDYPCIHLPLGGLFRSRLERFQRLQTLR